MQFGVNMTSGWSRRRHWSKNFTCIFLPYFCNVATQTIFNFQSRGNMQHSINIWAINILTYGVKDFAKGRMLNLFLIFSEIPPKWGGFASIFMYLAIHINTSQLSFVKWIPLTKSLYSNSLYHILQRCFWCLSFKLIYLFI